MKDKKRTVKYWIGRIHLWLGLTTGSIVFVLAITGCIYAFQAEIQNILQPYRFVLAEDKQTLSPAHFKEIGEKTLPDKHMHAIVYGRPGKAVQITYYNADPEYYYIVYLNPYSGEVLKVSNENAGFFRFILDGHFYLWLPHEIGQPIIASATLIFLFMTISGIVLWWPKNKNATKQRFTIKWSAKWRRKNYDLHNVLGFYCTWIALILAVTGLVWGFTWFAEGVYKITGGEKSMVYEEPLSDTTNANKGILALSMNKLYETIRRDNPKAEVIEVHIPMESSSALEVSVNPDDETYWSTDYRFFDQYSLKELEVNHVYGKLANASVADKLLRMNYDIHTGAVMGLPGKFLAFFGSLVIATLPITGFYIWLGRRHKDRLKNLPTDKKLVKKPRQVSAPAVP
ncbi:MAG: PepSY-associated TM helix domain-containing protein [Chryseolinea sp.]